MGYGRENKEKLSSFLVRARVVVTDISNSRWLLSSRPAILSAEGRDSTNGNIVSINF
jgi:hypothetical protein